jgi:hypothetical protein
MNGVFMQVPQYNGMKYKKRVLKLVQHCTSLIVACVVAMVNNFLILMCI